MPISPADGDVPYSRVADMLLDTQPALATASPAPLLQSDASRPPESSLPPAMRAQPFNPLAWTAPTQAQGMAAIAQTDSLNSQSL
ncbi:MAG TPA: hypothetical protein VLM78_10565, partial [Anaerolineales bacterium]|nr:hypothetical protein [Anaerolineales bacterium]